jgi:hypothetical protein
MFFPIRKHTSGLVWFLRNYGDKSSSLNYLSRLIEKHGDIAEVAHFILQTYFMLIRKWIMGTKLNCEKTEKKLGCVKWSDKHWIHILKMANELNCQHNKESTNQQFREDTTRGKCYNCLELGGERSSMMVLDENETYCSSWVTDSSFNSPKRGF